MEPEEKGSEETGKEQQANEAEKQSDLDLESVFGEQSFEEPPKPDETPSKDASGEEDTKGSKEDEAKQTEEEKAAAEAELKAAYDKMSDEEKGAADKTAADKVELELKAAYDKLSPEEKKATDEQKEKEVADAAEIKRVADGHAEALSKSEKRRGDTERWAQGLNQQQLELKREILILQRKAKDPDYDPEQDESLKEIGPTEEQKAASSERKGRAGASLKAAYGKYGKEVTEKGLAEYKELFAEDKMVQQQVMDSDMPVEEALGLVKLSKFFGKWGQDPDAIETKMRDDITKELTPKIREEESKRIMADLKKTNKLPKGLSNITDSTSQEEEGKKAERAARGSMEAIFDG